MDEFVDAFDYTYRPYYSNLDLCLIDVGSGSDTKVMAKQVLDWSKSNGGGKTFADPLFTHLKQKYA